ncbi:MAG: threonine synthase, partial [Anaerolineae bacterium]|nr:threonine synthase [Anaerolineae bacterium]
NAAAGADRLGFYCCPQTGAALAVLGKLARRGEIRPSESVVVISTAHGLKFTDFKVGYHEDMLDEVQALHSNPPVELPAKLGAVSEAIARALGG